MRPTPTAAIAAGSLIGGYGLAAASGSRPLGGAVLAAGGLCCVRVWHRRHGTSTAAALGGGGFTAFVLSNLRARAIGPWPAVLTLAGLTATIVWVRSDAPSRLPDGAPAELSRL